MVIINWEVGRGIQGYLVELIVRARNGHFTVQVDARTFCWEVTTVETVIGPAVVEGEVIRGEAIVITGFTRRLANRVQITPHRHLRLHVGQVVMHVT